jgi:glycerol-1-phosphatase
MILLFFSSELMYDMIGLVVEDAPNGVRSGQAAGCKTLAVITSHTRAQMEACSPDYLVQDLARFEVVSPLLSRQPLTTNSISVTMRLVSEGVEVTMEHI